LIGYLEIVIKNSLLLRPMRNYPQAKYNLPALTGLRFFAALYVILFHFDLRTPFNFLPGFLHELVAAGRLGVTLFFVLSGFILTFSYMNKVPEKFSGEFYRFSLLKGWQRYFPFI
jgi:peptidoglycan/LPS O-acetylase OafA/YrhL